MVVGVQGNSTDFLMCFCICVYMCACVNVCECVYVCMYLCICVCGLS